MNQKPKNNLKKKSFILLSCLIATLIVTTTVSAEELKPSKNTNRILSIKTELKNLSNRYGVDISLQNDATDEEIKSFKLSEIENIAKYLSSHKVLKRSAIKNEQIRPMASGTTTVSGTASIWCGVPALGWGYIDIPYTYNYYIRTADIIYLSCTTEPSYQVGLTIATWAPRKTWSEITDGGLYLTLYSEGIMHYIKSGVNIQADQTYEYDVNQ